MKSNRKCDNDYHSCPSCVSIPPAAPPHLPITASSGRAIDARLCLFPACSNPLQQPTTSTRRTQHTTAISTPAMLRTAASTAVRAAGPRGSAARAFSTTPVPAATLRELESRVKSVKNIEKVCLWSCCSACAGLVSCPLTWLPALYHPDHKIHEDDCDHPSQQGASW